MQIAIASGKGGTGKTLVATNLCRTLEQMGRRVIYVDTDVEAPNGHLFLKPSSVESTPVTVRIPVLKEKHCAGHGKCQEICAFNAILAAKGSIWVFEELCHSCGACVLACPDDALTEKQRVVGELQRGTIDNSRFIAGCLNVGEARSVPLIAAVLQEANQAAEDDIVVVDAPPGVACAAVETVKGADLALLVTEPTPFGCHDLDLAIRMCHALSIETAAIVNRADLGDREVYRLLENHKVPILAEIPFEKKIASSYAGAELAVESSPTLRCALESVVRHIDARLGAS